MADDFDDLVVSDDADEDRFSQERELSEDRDDDALDAADDGDDATASDAAPQYAKEAAVAVPRPARPAATTDAPDGPPPAGWAPARLGIRYAPCQLSIEYECGGARFLKCVGVSAEDAGSTPEECLARLERDFEGWFDFEAKLSRTQALSLLGMLLDNQASRREQ